MPQPHRTLRLAACVVLLLVVSGCGDRLHGVLGASAPPEVRITETRAEPGRTGLATYRLRWTGHAPGGRVDHYLVATDPRELEAVDSSWKATREDQFVLSFPADELLRARAARPPRRDFHLFAVRTVDAAGAMSLPATRAFFPDNIAPTVQIISPRPSSLLETLVPPALFITWQGDDPDGVSTGYKPVKYKYKLFQRTDPVLWALWMSNPDSLRRQVAPEFAGWDSVPAGGGPAGPDSTQVHLTNLTPNSEYLFVVVAIDTAGDYSPDWSLNTNMLRMLVGFSIGFEPKITLFNSFFSYAYASGGVPTPLDLSWAIRLQVPGRQPVTFNWSAVASVGSAMRRYRWALDLAALDDETPRTGPNDWYHWSPWSLDVTSATVGPFAGRGLKRESHDFFLEAEDINGLVSLGWVQFAVVHPTFDRDVLIVNDTRFLVDQVSRMQPPGRSDSLMAPSGAWPTRAELDTFLFAVGGMRWRMTPPGRLSPAGIFNGYRFDTVGTRYGRENPAVPLDLLGQYRHVVWMTDQKAVGMTGNPTGPLPMTALLYMSMPNRQNTLATWVSQGGKLWALGSGFGNATNAPWNNVNNDVNGTRTYSSAGTRPDLTPGRFMFDWAHWRSEFRAFGPVFVQYARYDQPDPTVGSPPPANYWKGGVFRNPDYALLPVTLQPRDPLSDPIWPYRMPTDWFLGNPNYSPLGICLEFISLENYIREQVPGSGEEISTLDSLYLTYGPSYPAQMLQAGQGVNAVMTYYHGQDNAPLVSSGTSIWDFRRQDCVGLVDFVLGTLWGLSRSASPSTTASMPALRRAAAVPNARPAPPLLRP